MKKSRIYHNTVEFAENSHLFSVKNIVIGGFSMSRRGENIYHRKDGRWEGRYIKYHSPIEKTVYGYVYAASYKEVKEKLLQAKKSIEQSKLLANDFIFGEIATQWLNRKRVTVKHSTITLYENKITNYILPYFKKQRISTISTVMLQSFIDCLLTGQFVSKNKKLSAKTISDILTILKSILRYAEQLGCILSCNLSILKMKYETKEIKVLSQEEQVLVNKKLIYSTDYTSLGILLSLYTGIRIGELCSLTTNDIDISQSKLRIWRTLQRMQYDCSNGNKTVLKFTEPKSKKSVREIPLPSFIVNKIKEIEYSDGVFLLSGTNTPVEPRTMENRYNRFMEELNIYGTSFHTLRHTFATRCVEAQFDTKTLSEILGHATVGLTLNRYVHPSFDLKVENMNKIVFAV